MSTRSLIGYQCDDGSIYWSYVHFDGYPEGREPLLHKNYNTFQDAKALVDLGQLRSIEETLEDCDVFEENAFHGMVKNLEDFLKLDHGADYKYLFTKGEWYWCKCWGLKYPNEVMEILPYNYKTITIYD